MEKHRPVPSSNIQSGYSRIRRTEIAIFDNPRRQVWQRGMEAAIDKTIHITWLVVTKYRSSERMIANMALQACDLVIKYEVLKAQNILEDRARKQWAQKWKFYLDFDKMLLEEAKKQGIPEAEYKRRTELRKPKGSLEPAIWKIEPTKRMPATTTGQVGLRASKEYSLEKFGPLYVSPKLTLPYEAPYNSIFLG